MKSNLTTIAFYNTENFYSKDVDASICIGDPMKWKASRYEAKLNNIAFCISKIGFQESHQLPSIVGLAEVENDKVLNDLINHEVLKDGNYKGVIYESLEKRKINVALLYQSKHFEVLENYPIRLVFKDLSDNKSYTRDVLYVKGLFFNELIHLFMVHLPSRRDQEINKIKRQLLLKKVKEKIDHLLSENPSEKVF